MMKKPRQLVNVEVVCTPVTDVDIIPVPITGVDIEPEIAPGIRGTTFIPAVSSEGIISWTNDGDLPNPDPVLIKGPQGDPTIVNGKTGASIELTYEDVGAVPTARTINGYALSSNVNLTAHDVGALSSIDFDVIDCGSSREVV